MEVQEKIAAMDWPSITESMHQKGYAIARNLLSATQCGELINNYNIHHLYRKTVVMERYRFGFGEYRYFDYPLPNLIEEVRKGIYPYLVPIANIWMKALNINQQFPHVLAELKLLCDAQHQTKPTVLILKYGKGGFNTLHQDLYGEIYFPIQIVLFLNEPDQDYQGGEFVLTEQVPRAQSKAIVLKPKKGDVLFFTTNFRPVKGAKGYYRVSMKHGVSELHSGERHTLGIIFHDAVS